MPQKSKGYEFAREVFARGTNLCELEPQKSKGYEFAREVFARGPNRNELEPHKSKGYEFAREVFARGTNQKPGYSLGQYRATPSGSVRVSGRCKKLHLGIRVW